MLDWYAQGNLYRDGSKEDFCALSSEDYQKMVNFAQGIYYSEQDKKSSQYDRAKVNAAEARYLEIKSYANE